MKTGKSYVAFTKEMKKEYTILVPTMLPRHFELIISVLKTYGYKAELLRTEGPEIAETGLKYVHNDTCYPAVLVVGQFIDALKSGRYDPHKVALILFQTGGGCRASNYIFLLRKALEKAGFGYVPVISFNLLGLEKHPGFQLNLPILRSMMYAVMYGDLLLTLVNQCKPYEKIKGTAEQRVTFWTEKLSKELGSGGKVRYEKIKENYKAMIADFAAIEKEKKKTVKVGIVGEIFVKYSPLGNNDLEQFLVREGAEAVIPGLLDFCLFCVFNNIEDYEIYGLKPAKHIAASLAFSYLNKKKQDIIDLMKEEGSFTPLTPFQKTIDLCRGYIGYGAKMGEGWLLTAEMLELAESGVKNIVCVQPFGCLPNHICGKGMMRPIKEKNPDINIVAVDYDPGATRVNQENRLKLMLSNAFDAAEVTL